MIDDQNRTDRGYGHTPQSSLTNTSGESVWDVDEGDAEYYFIHNLHMPDYMFYMNGMLLT